MKYTNFKIDKIEDLEKFFIKNPKLNCFVTSIIRESWLINHKVVMIDKKKFYVFFKDMQGGVWQAWMSDGKKKDNKNV